jgi:hypothetical protein
MSDDMTNTEEVPATKARQGVTGMKVRYVLLASTVGTAVGLAVAYGIVI